MCVNRRHGIYLFGANRAFLNMAVADMAILLRVAVGNMPVLFGVAVGNVAIGGSVSIGDGMPVGGGMAVADRVSVGHGGVDLLGGRVAIVLLQIGVVEEIAE